MLLMLDTMAQRYGMLPSELLTKADTFDLMVMDVAFTYTKYQHDKQNNKFDPKMYDQDDLMDKLKNVRK